MPLDAEEQAELDRIVRSQPAATRGDGSLVGELAVLRRARHVMPFVCGLMLAPILVGLDAPAAGIALAIVVVVAFVVHGRMRIARLRITEAGDLSLPGHAEIDWSTLQRLELGYRYPLAATHVTRVHDETLHLRFVLGDGRSITVARGPIWRVRPSREPIGCHRVDRWLKRRVQAAGLQVRGTPKGWIATRPGAAEA